MRHKEVFKGEVHLSRDTNAQLRIMEEAAMRIVAGGDKPQVSIHGINALGPLHQGLKTHRRILQNDGSMRLLLLDPRSGTFKERVKDEDDQEERLSYEMQAALADVKNLDRTRDSRGNIQVRLTSEYPDRSLIMVHRMNQSGDVDYGTGVAMINLYPNKPGSRGLEGVMGTVHPDSSEAREVEVFNENVRHFNRKWDAGVGIEVVQAKPIEIWSFIPQEQK